MDAITRETLELTQALIPYRSTASRPDQRQACADHIALWLDEAGVAFSRTRVDGVDSILALPPQGPCRVLLMTHFDVVDGPDDLFTPRLEGGRLHGRGAIDDKYAAALSMALMKRQRSNGCRNLGILITGDEETGGRCGAQQALKGLAAEFCIALDGGDPLNLVTLEKGVLRLKIVSPGVAAHGARPWLGVNAIEALMEDLAAVKALFTLNEPDHWHPTLNIGTISGGTAVNMVPAQAQALLDIRYTENDYPEAILAQVRAAVSGQAELVRLDPVFNGGHGPLLEALKRHAPAGARFSRAHGASDARFLSENGIPGVVWGADGGGSQHGEAEYLDIDSLKTLAASLCSFLDSLDG